MSFYMFRILIRDIEMYKVPSTILSQLYGMKLSPRVSRSSFMKLWNVPTKAREAIMCT
jgi:hypothetical protein